MACSRPKHAIACLISLPVTAVAAAALGSGSARAGAARCGPQAFRHEGKTAQLVPRKATPILGLYSSDDQLENVARWVTASGAFGQRSSKRSDGRHSSMSVGLRNAVIWESDAYNGRDIGDWCRLHARYSAIIRFGRMTVRDRVRQVVPHELYGCDPSSCRRPGY